MRRSLVLCVLVVFLTLGAGCGRGSFVGKRLDNFSAYYNTYYNAEKALDEGVDGFSTGLEGQPLNQDIYLSLFGRSEGATTQRQPFEDAIKKSADILRKHPDSKWVDDAMMVIGRAWFFTQNYVGAEQYFGEVMALESRLRDEARFWLARTLIASGQYDAAFDHLQESLNRDDLSRRWEPTLHLALAELHVQRKSWDEALVELEAGVEGVRDNELAARSQFLLGQVYETLGRYEEAIAAYDRVQAYKPFYELSYAAQFSAVRVEGEHGDPDQAMRRLRRMERDDKNYDHRAELAYLRGRILQASGRYEDALDVYYELLYDPTANATSVRGQTYYALGVFHREVYEDYPYAAAYFDTAQTSLSRPTTTGGAGRLGGSAAPPSYAPAAITDSKEQARVFGSFADVMDRINKKDSLLYLGSLDDSTFEATILEIRKQRAEELEAQRREMERLRAERQFQQAGTDPVNNTYGRTSPGKQIGNTTANNDAGFLFHRDAVRMQEARADFNLKWGIRPLVPNWRRLDAINNVGIDGGVSSDSTLAEGTDSPEDELPEVDISEVPRDSLGQRQMRTERAMARYELANVLFLSMNRPDSAATWYRMVIEEDGEEHVAQRAYYALAEVQRALGDTLTAQRLYRTILDRYPESDFSKQASERLGIQPNEEVSSDTLAMAEAVYNEVYASWQRQDYAQSLNEMVMLALNYPTTKVAPRALLAAGSVFMEWATRDSLDLFGALPLIVADSVLYASDLFRPLTAPASGPPTTPGAGGDSLAVEVEMPAWQDDTPVKQVNPPDKEERRPVKQLDARDEEEDAPVKQLDPAIEEADSLAQVADSLALRDLMLREGVLADSTTLSPDSTTLSPDSTTLSPDSTTLSPDSTGASSVVVPEDSTAAPTDVIVPSKPEPVRLKTLYERLMAHYPQSPQAPKAGRILEALQERQDALQAIADSLAADSLAAIEALALADTLAQGVDSLAQVVPDTLALVAAEEEGVRPQNTPEDRRSRLEGQTEALPDSSAVPKEKDGLLRTFDESRERSERARPAVPTDSVGAVADWIRGGYTLIIASETQRILAERTARRYRQNFRSQSLPVDVLVGEDDGATRYRVAVGQMETREEALALRERLVDDLPSDCWIFQVEPDSGAEARDTTDEPADASVDSLAVPSESVRAVPEPDARPAAEDPDVAPNQPSAEPPSVGLGNIDWSQGGWTIVIHTATTPAQAEGFARNFSNYVRDLSHPVDIFTAPTQEGVAYRVGIGLFASEVEVEKAFASIKDRLPGDAQVAQIPKTP